MRPKSEEKGEKIKEHCICARPIREAQKNYGGKVIAEMCLRCVRPLAVQCALCDRWIRCADFREHTAKDHPRPKAPKPLRETLTPLERFIAEKAK